MVLSTAEVWAIGGRIGEQVQHEMKLSSMAKEPNARMDAVKVDTYCVYVGLMAVMHFEPCRVRDDEHLGRKTRPNGSLQLPVRKKGGGSCAVSPRSCG